MSISGELSSRPPGWPRTGALALAQEAGKHRARGPDPVRPHSQPLSSQDGEVDTSPGTPPAGKPLLDFSLGQVPRAHGHSPSGHGVLTLPGATGQDCAQVGGLFIWAPCQDELMLQIPAHQHPFTPSPPPPCSFPAVLPPQNTGLLQGRHSRAHIHAYLLCDFGQVA